MTPRCRAHRRATPRWKKSKLQLDAFEEGYRAGWDDAIKAQSDDRTRISEFAQNLQDLSFTYHEAYSHAINAMTPLLEDIVRSVLPKIAHEAWARISSICCRPRPARSGRSP